MRTRILVSIIAVVGISLIGILGENNYKIAEARCSQNLDWPSAPCYQYRLQDASGHESEWAKYYDYKGADFMTAKKLEMLDALRNGNLCEWISSGPPFQNTNVLTYYFVNGVVSSIDCSIARVQTDPTSNGNIESIFNSKNGTGLIALKTHEKVNIVFTYQINNEIFDGYAYYNIIEDGKRITNSENFTTNESPKTFTFSYTPQHVGIFPFTKGVISNSGDYHREESQSIIVLEKFGKAMKFNGQCKKPFPEFTLVIKPDFSTGTCVKMDTSVILKERGWH